MTGSVVQTSPLTLTHGFMTSWCLMHKQDLTIFDYLIHTILPSSWYYIIFHQSLVRLLYYYNRNGGHGSQRRRKCCYFGACHGSRRGMLLNPGGSAHHACHNLSQIFRACGALSDTTVTSVVKIAGVTVAPPCWLLESNNQPRHSHNPGPLRSK